MVLIRMHATTGKKRSKPMKICITSRDDSLESEVDPRFGRCSWFILVDSESMDFEAVPNEIAGMSGGAGIQAAQFMSEKGVGVVVTGNCGPNAFRTLGAAGIEVFTGASGTVKDALDAYRSGKLESSQGPNVGSHFGMKGDG
jgi:predicted Fe-Mo cluster-binding NifX family protein